jgi:hypothetical protein
LLNRQVVIRWIGTAVNLQLLPSQINQPVCCKLQLLLCCKVCPAHLPHFLHCQATQGTELLTGAPCSWLQEVRCTVRAKGQLWAVVPMDLLLLVLLVLRQG